MDAPLYDASVPVFQHYLHQLRSLLAKAQTFSDITFGVGNSMPLLQARLHDTMLPFATQVEISCNFALRTCAPLAGLGVPEYGNFSHDFVGLASRIEFVLSYLAQLRPEQMQGAEHRVISDQAGQHMQQFSAHVFLHLYALPNFFFHLSMTYAILRHLGVNIGKADFDGVHQY